MQVAGFDERNVVSERLGSNFIVFIYEQVSHAGAGSVDSLLLTDTDLPQVLSWLQDHLPADSCWSLGVVTGPAEPTSHSNLEIAWVVGGDVLNIAPSARDPEEHRLAGEMLARGPDVTLT